MKKHPACKLFDSLIVFLKEFLEKVHFEKVSKSMKKHPACKLFDTLIVFLKEFLEKVHFEKKWADNNKSMKNTQYAKA